MVNTGQYLRSVWVRGDGKRGISMRVLLIEDEPTTAKAIELMLTTEGFNV